MNPPKRVESDSGIEFEVIFLERVSSKPQSNIWIAVCSTDIGSPLMVDVDGFTVNIKHGDAASLMVRSYDGDMQHH